MGTIRHDFCAPAQCAEVSGPRLSHSIASVVDILFLASFLEHSCAPFEWPLAQ